VAISLKALIYLWTRDADMEVCEENEAYISDHIKAMNDNPIHEFSDKAREAMADRIVKADGGRTRPVLTTPPPTKAKYKTVLFGGK